jgi:hypothetical protein
MHSLLLWVLLFLISPIFAQTLEINYFEDSDAQYGFITPPPVKILVNGDTLTLDYKSSQTLKFPLDTDILRLEIVSPAQHREQSPMILTRSEFQKYRLYIVYSSINKQLQLSKTDTTLKSDSEQISQPKEQLTRTQSFSSEATLGCALLGVLVGAGVGGFIMVQKYSNTESTAPMDVGALGGGFLGLFLGGAIGGAIGGMACSN